MTSKSLKIIDFSRFEWGESPISGGLRAYKSTRDGYGHRQGGAPPYPEPGWRSRAWVQLQFSEVPYP